MAREGFVVTEFLSTPSARRATLSIVQLPGSQQVFLSTPSARRATLKIAGFVEALRISIHALREEGDARATSRTTRPSHFYPRPPRGGRPPL